MLKRAASVDSLPDGNSSFKQLRTWRSPSLGALISEASAPGIAGPGKATTATTAAHRKPNARNEKADEIASPLRAPVIRKTSAPVSNELENPMIDAQGEGNSFTARVEDIADWLFNAWTVLPFAHNDLCKQLLALGTASHERLSSWSRISQPLESIAIGLLLLEMLQSFPTHLPPFIVRSII